MFKIIKRNGREVDFDKQKIVSAIDRADKEANKEDRLTPGKSQEIAKNIENTIINSDRPYNVEEIQNMVEQELIKSGNAVVSVLYIRYRYKRELVRGKNTTYEKIMSLISLENEDVKQENSNKNPVINSTQRDYIAGIVNEDIAKQYMLPEKIVEADEKGIIHVHDKDYFAMNETNCCLVNLEDMLQNGTVINGTMIEKPKSFSVACNIATQSMAQIASSQYGGQSINIAHLAPFVDVSRQKFIKEYKDEFEKLGIDINSDKFKNFIEDEVKNEIKKGVQIIQYQINTLMTCNGQTPFVTVFMYLGDAKSELEKDDLALIIEEMLRQRYLGTKNEEGVYISPAFPKLIYVLDEDNAYEGSKYFYLTKMSAKCSAKRMVPDYISAKVMRKIKEGNVYSSMGCVDGDETVLVKINGQKEEWITFKEFRERFEYKAKYVEESLDNTVDLKDEDVLIYDNNENKFVKCYGIIQKWRCNWVKLVFEQGASLMCTIDHPLHIIGKGTKLASSINIGDQVLFNDKLVKLISMEYKCFRDNPKPSYDVTTETEHFMVSGIYSHNCRSFLAPWYDDNNKAKFWGRFNIGVTTINLPHVALSSGRDKEKFWKIFDERLELCYEALMIRYKKLLKTPSDVAPIMWQYGAISRLKKGEPIGKLFENGYCSISLGYAGLYECVYYMEGKSHTDPSATPFAIEVMEYMNQKVEEWKERSGVGLGFSIYGTPIESTTYKFAKANQRDFGIIPEVTEYPYITNSYHINVREPIDAFSKLEFESQFQNLSTGGAISYVEIPNMQNNLDSVVSVLQFIYEHIMYAELNTKSDYCHICEWDGEIKIVKDEETGKLVWECPRCGNRDQNKMDVARRTCGYIGVNFWNQGRTAEIKDRVLHL